MGYFEGFGVTLRQHRLFGGKRVTAPYSGGRVAKRVVSRRHGKRKHGESEGTAAAEPLAAPDIADDVKADKPPRLHGRHVLGRYEDGMEKCIGCELCAGVCPAQCIYVRGADNDAENPTSPGERYGFVYEINYLRCIHCDLCVEACPTEAITESKLFEFSFTNRDDAIYTKTELLVGDDGRPQHLPWEDWREGEDADTSGWVRATAPSGDADFIGARRLERRARLRRAGSRAAAGRGRRRDGSDTSASRRQRADSRAVDASEPSRGRRDRGGVMQLVVFVIASLMVLVGAVGVVVRRHPVHCALSLVLTLFGIAVHFVALEAHFLAAVQVIVYAGAIVVLFLFVIMLLGVDTGRGSADRAAADPAPAGRGDGARDRRPARRRHRLGEGHRPAHRRHRHRRGRRDRRSRGGRRPRRQHPPARPQPVR